MFNLTLCACVSNNLKGIKKWKMQSFLFQHLNFPCYPKAKEENLPVVLKEHKVWHPVIHSIFSLFQQHRLFPVGGCFTISFFPNRKAESGICSLTDAYGAFPMPTDSFREKLHEATRLCLLRNPQADESCHQLQLLFDYTQKLLPSYPVSAEGSAYQQDKHFAHKVNVLYLQLQLPQ